MALSAAILSLIHDEIGDSTNAFFSDDTPHTPPQLDSLENIYADTARGNLNVLRTALICWRFRRNNYIERGFDATAGGSLMARRQHMKSLEQKVKEYELLVDTTKRHANTSLQSVHVQSEAIAGGAEF